jgi:hypothetical protein
MAVLKIDWTPAEWENLEHVNNTLARLLAERQPTSLDNGAYVARLRITLKTLADYHDAITLAARAT